jgi:hypothetical protein
MALLRRYIQNIIDYEDEKEVCNPEGHSGGANPPGA